MLRKIPYRNLAVTDDVLRNRILQRVDTVLQHGQILLGPEVNAFEQQVAEYCDRRYCVGVGSGTDALCVALKLLDIGPGDEVITTPLSWIATLHAIDFVGATPVFVDIGDDLNLNISEVEEKITDKTKAILPVHFTGRMCDMSAIMKIAEKYRLYVIEDAAQSFGAYCDGRRAGGYGTIGCFSMNPMKIFPAYGEAGAILMDEKAMYEKAIQYRYLGTVEKDVCLYPSLNWKIDTIQAAILLETFSSIEDIILRRIEIAKEYTHSLKEIVSCPSIVDDVTNRSVYFDYVIQVDKRDKLKQYLDGVGIETKIKHPILMPDQPAYPQYGKLALPNARRLVNRILSLPLSEKMSVADVRYVVDKIKTFFI